MKAEELLALYERVTEAPDAIARLRGLVLELAVHGKLTTPLTSWTNTTLGEVGAWGSGGTPSRTNSEYYGGDIPWLVIGDLNDSIVTDATTYITEEGLKNSSAKLVAPGTVLVAMYGSIGKLGVAGMTCATNQAIAHCAPNAEVVSTHFLVLLLRSMRDQLLARGQGVAQQNISQKILKAWPIRIPLLAEQQSIVAKVDELMALLDRLEAARSTREATRNRLTTATLVRLASSEADAGTLLTHARFALDALPALTTHADQIKQIRQTILRLAVQGKLVEQNQADEPALALLSSIGKDKAQRMGPARSARMKAIEALSEADTPSSLPRSWAWVAFGDITISRDGERIPVSKAEREGRDGVFDYYGASGVIDKIDGYLFDKPLLLIGEDGANLINRSTPIAFIARGKYWVNNHAHVVDALNEELLRYLEIFINAIDLKPFVTGAAQPKMNQAKMNSIPVALPPLAEQHRIVAKVDELMALCDRLEAALQVTDSRRERLLEALLIKLQPALSFQAAA